MPPPTWSPPVQHPSYTPPGERVVKVLPLATKMTLTGMRLMSQTMAYISNQPIHVNGARRFP